MKNSPKTISAFYSPKIHIRLPAATYAFGDAEAQTSNRARGDGSLIRERTINIWWQGALDEVFGLVKFQFPDASPCGTITSEGKLLLPPLSDNVSAWPSGDATRNRKDVLKERRAAAGILRGLADPGAGGGEAEDKLFNMLAVFEYEAKLDIPLPPRGRRLPKFNGNGIIPTEGILEIGPASSSIPLPAATEEMRPKTVRADNVVSLFDRRRPK
jgi:hypothetical protein